jgi:phospholipase C
MLPLHHAPPAHVARHVAYTTSPAISHVVVIFQQGRNLTDLFGSGPPPGVSIPSSGIDHNDNPVPLAEVSLGACGDPQHALKDFQTAYDLGAMDGWDLLPVTCGPGTTVTPYSYAPATEVMPYVAWASQYATSDATFQPNRSTLWPAFLYVLAGQSGGYEPNGMAFSENAAKTMGDVTCAAPANTRVPQVYMGGSYPSAENPGAFPCLGAASILELLDRANVPWKYYVAELNSRPAAPLSFSYVYQRDRANVITPETTVLNDIRNGSLPPVAFVTASLANSDNPPENGSQPGSNGPNWVSSVVAALEASPDWSNTVVLLTWVDSANWYDDVAPPSAPNPVGGIPNPFEYGFRVPLIAISPLANRGYVDHTPRSLVSITRFLETVYALPSLGTLDQFEPDDLSPFFAVPL